MICNKCNHKLPDDSNFCQYCGSQVLGFTVIEQTDNESIEPSQNLDPIKLNLDKAFTCLEIGRWEKADGFFEQVLEEDIKNSDAYLGKCMVDLHVENKESIAKKGRHIVNNKNFKLAYRFANKIQKTDLQNIINEIQNNIQQRKLESKKIFSITAIALSCLITLSLLAYFVGVPYGRYLWYKSMLSDGDITKATSAYTSSMWFEYESKVKELFYKKAIQSIDNNELIQAEILLKATPKYKDSDEKLNDIENPLKIAKIQHADVGDYIEFGSYEQDANYSNGLENIEWLVLEKTDTKALLISKYGLDCIPFTNKQVHNATWETSNLRKWLNSSFYNDAFSDFEKPNIILSEITNYDYKDIPLSNNFFISEKDPKKSTNDYLFVFSDEEAEKYFPTSKSRKVKPTQYAKNMGAYISYGDGKHAWWWLRNNPDMNGNHSIISGKGGISTNSLPPSCETITVRPAMWIDISEIK